MGKREEFRDLVSRSLCEDQEWISIERKILVDVKYQLDILGSRGRLIELLWASFRTSALPLGFQNVVQYCIDVIRAMEKIKVILVFNGCIHVSSHFRQSIEMASWKKKIRT